MGFLDKKTCRHDFFVDCMLWDKLRRLWRLAVAPQPQMQDIAYSATKPFFERS